MRFKILILPLFIAACQGVAPQQGVGFNSYSSSLANQARVATPPSPTNLAAPTEPTASPASTDSTATLAANAGPVPHYKMTTAQFNETGTPVSGDSAADKALKAGITSFFYDNALGAPFSVADVSGKLRRVTIDGIDYGVITKFKEGLFGSKIRSTKLYAMMGQAAAAQIGCTFEGGLYVRKFDYTRNGFVIPLTC
jgi:hypothetical protein